MSRFIEIITIIVALIFVFLSFWMNSLFVFAAIGTVFWGIIVDEYLIR